MPMKKNFLQTGLAIGWLLAGTAVRAGPPPATEAMKLTLAAPISTWDEALPLGNGLLGGLLWGGGGTLRLSLDRGDLWDERPAPGDPLKGFTYARLKELVAAKDNEAVIKIADVAYQADHPTKIPAGRLELDLAPGQAVTAFELDEPGAARGPGRRGGSLFQRERPGGAAAGAGRRPAGAAAAGAGVGEKARLSRSGARFQ